MPILISFPFFNLLGVFRVFRRQTEPDLRHVQQHCLCLIIFRSLRYFQALFGKTLILIRR